MIPVLNDDLMIEILQWFVSMDELGPYTLFHVSNIWRTILLQTPSLWTWITIDPLYDDLEERVQMSTHMSGSLPLHFRIKIRGRSFPKAPWLTPHLHRADLLILQRTDTERERFSQKQVFSQIRFFLEGGEWSPALRVVWMRKDEIEGVKLDKITREKTHIYHKHLSPSSLMLRNGFATLASVATPHWEGDTPITEILSSMRCLLELRLWDQPVNIHQFGSQHRDKKPIYLPPLRILQLGTLKHNPVQHGPGSLHNLRFAAYLELRAEHLGIQDGLLGLISTVGHIGAHIQPKTLSLYPLDVHYTSGLKLHHPLTRLYRLNIDLTEFTQAISEEEMPSMVKTLHSLLLNVSTICVCRLTVTPSTFSYVFHFLALHETASREIRFEVAVYETDKAVVVTPSAAQKPPGTVSTVLGWYELRPRNLSYSGRFSTQHLVIKTRWDCEKVSTTLSSLLATPDGNYSHLQHLDTGRVDFELEEDGVRLPRIPSLTILRCVPEVAVSLLRASSVPALQELNMVDNIYGGDGNAPNHRLVGEIFELLSSGDCHHLQTLRFQFYPHWLDLLEFLANVTRRESQVDYRIALPSYPSRLILGLLVDVLKGESKDPWMNDPILLEEPWTFNEFKKGSWGKREQCYYCFCSHRKDCKGESTVACMRHPKDSPVEIAKYSLM